MTITSPLRSFLRAFARRPKAPVHPDAVFEPRLALPRRIDDPVTAARLACDLLRNRTEDVTLALYLDDRHRVVGHAVVAVGWVQGARLSARQILLGSLACRASACVLVRYHRRGPLSASLSERRSYGAIAGEAARQGLHMFDHLVVVGSGGLRSCREL
jgi:DNA repair protein RadC